MSEAPPEAGGGSVRASVFRAFLVIVGLGLLALGWWVVPRPLADAQFRPPPGLPISLQVSGVFRQPWFLNGLDVPMNVMVRLSRGISGEVLAVAIRGSARQATREGLRPVPRALRERLARHYGEAIVARVGWTVRGRRIELGSLLTAWVLEEGAVTLEDVIVFDHADLAENLWLWAHELAHVEQFRRLGVDGFARAYLADWQGMEAEATARANAVVAAIREEERESPVRWLGVEG